MINSAPGILQADWDDKEDSVSAAVAAFSGNSLFVHLLGKGKAYLRRVPAYFRFMVTGALQNGSVYFLDSPERAFIFLVPDSNRLFTLKNEIAAGGSSSVSKKGFGTGPFRVCGVRGDQTKLGAHLRNDEPQSRYLLSKEQF